MKATRFDPQRDLIFVESKISSCSGARRGLRSVLDTSVSEFLDEIGYGQYHGDRITSTTSAIGDEPGYLMPVTRFSA